MKNRIFRRIASLRGTHPIAVLSVLSRVSRVNKLLQQLCSTEKTLAVLRSVRLTLHPKSAIFMRTLNFDF